MPLCPIDEKTGKAVESCAHPTPETKKKKEEGKSGGGSKKVKVTSSRPFFDANQRLAILLNGQGPSSKIS